MVSSCAVIASPRLGQQLLEFKRQCRCLIQSGLFGSARSCLSAAVDERAPRRGCATLFVGFISRHVKCRFCSNSAAVRSPSGAGHVDATAPLAASPVPISLRITQFLRQINLHDWQRSTSSTNAGVSAASDRKQKGAFRAELVQILQSTSLFAFDPYTNEVVACVSGFFARFPLVESHAAEQGGDIDLLRRTFDCLIGNVQGRVESTFALGDAEKAVKEQHFRFGCRVGEGEHSQPQLSRNRQSLSYSDRALHGVAVSGTSALQLLQLLADVCAVVATARDEDHLRSQQDHSHRSTERNYDTVALGFGEQQRLKNLQKWDDFLARVLRTRATSSAFSSCDFLQWAQALRSSPSASTSLPKVRQALVDVLDDPVVVERLEGETSRNHSARADLVTLADSVLHLQTSDDGSRSGEQFVEQELQERIAATSIVFTQANATSATTEISQLAAAVGRIVCGFPGRRAFFWSKEDLLRIVRVCAAAVDGAAASQSPSCSNSTRNYTKEGRREPALALELACQEIRRRFATRSMLNGYDAADFLELFGQIQHTDETLLHELWLAIRSAVGEMANDCFGLPAAPLPTDHGGHIGVVIRKHDRRLRAENPALHASMTLRPPNSDEHRIPRRTSRRELFLFLHRLLVGTSHLHSSTGAKALIEVSEIICEHDLHNDGCFAERFACLRGFATANVFISSTLVQKLSMPDFHVAKAKPSRTVRRYGARRIEALSLTHRRERPHVSTDGVDIDNFCEVAALYSSVAELDGRTVTDMRKKIEQYLLSPSTSCSREESLGSSEKIACVRVGGNENNVGALLELSDLVNCLQFYIFSSRTTSADAAVDDRTRGSLDMTVVWSLVLQIAGAFSSSSGAAPHSCNPSGDHLPLIEAVEARDQVVAIAFLFWRNCHDWCERSPLVVLRALLGCVGEKVEPPEAEQEDERLRRMVWQTVCNLGLGNAAQLRPVFEIFPRSIVIGSREGSTARAGV
ncbi:unnamed protein product [Amoebophrya sp. A120]|nr:unnamed protein product [Amoebophrya sp. A120]|eukprot:GSA120T00006380001.1